MVETWYGFCDRFLQSKDIKLDFAQMAGNPNFWQDAARLVSETVLNDGTPEEWLFDTLIIDEAQDFEEGWFEIVRLFLKDDSDILWLEDPNQNVRGVAPPALKDLGFVGYRSLLNLRSPETIARFIRQTLPDFEFTCANDLPGLGVGVTSYEEPADQPKVVGKIVGRLLSDRFKQTQIAVLSCKGLNSTVFKDIQRVGNHTLSRFTGQYDLFGNQIFSNGQILFDTVRRFKGQQAAAVILTDIDPNESHLREDLSVVFCGMTRATVRLEIVCNRSNEWIHEKLLPAI
jgi:superfamily I DNA and RNA helicase